MGNKWDRGSKRRGFERDDFGGQDRGDYQPRPARIHSAGDDDGPLLDATVKWFKGDKGFGFVELGDGSGDAFLHIKVVERAGHATVEPGAKLRVQVAEGQKGRQVTTIADILDAGGAARPTREPPRRPSAVRASGPTSEVAGTVKWYDAGKGFGF